MAIVSHTLPDGGDKPAKIYAETPNIQYFVGSGLLPDSDDGPTNIGVTFPSTTRQQYPGDSTPVSTSGGTRVVLVDPSRKSGNAIPGKVFILARYGPTGILLEKRQFSYTGSWVKVHAFLRSECVAGVYAYNSSGARYTITDPD